MIKQQTYDSPIWNQLHDGFDARGKEAALLPALRTPSAVIYLADCLELMSRMPDNCMVFADPPYLLSNNGLTCQGGRMVSVNKGKWDKSNGFENDLAFHETWMSECQRILKPEGTIWISGTYHSIYQCGFLLQKLGFHLLNDIAWLKPNAAPNLSCRVFTASHETLLWARKDKAAKHYFNYAAMKEGSFENDALKKPHSQMRSVWSIPTTPGKEKKLGKHPTQKPLALLSRILLATSKEGDIIFDPFCGSATTAVAAMQLPDRRFVGAEMNPEYIQLAAQRLNSLQGE